MAVTPGWNPFQAQNLLLPEDYEWMKELTKTAGGDSGAKRGDDDVVAPFNRLVDGWLLSIALGIRSGDEVHAYEPPAHKFETGARLASDEHAIRFLHHAALAEMLKTAKDHESQEEAAYKVIEEPAKVIAICNDLAARGVPILRQMVNEATLPTLPALTRALSGELK